MINGLHKSIYEFETFRLDPTRRLLFRENGEQVALTPKPFELLLTLIENKGKLLTKDELMEKVWSDSFVEEANLTQTISVLRKSLGEKRDEHRFIVTEPGQGYRFVANVVEKSEIAEPEIAENEDSEIEDFEKDETLLIKKTAPADGFKFKPLFRKPFFIFLTIILLLGIPLAAVFLYQKSESTTQPAKINEIKTIAVLPFRDIGSGEDKNQLGLGMSDTLAFKLSNLKQIVVRQTNTVSHYAESSADPTNIGRELKVDALLEDSIQTGGEHIRVNARLIRVNDGATLWADTFVDTFTNIFAVQDTISEKVVNSLELQLTGEEQKLIKKRYTENIEAYQLYQRGRFFWSKRTREGFLKSIELFEQAIEKDANYALPYTGLADAYHLLGDYSYLAPQDSILKAKESALKALELDNTLSEAHNSLAYAKFLYDWDWAGAENSFKRALELNPNYATAHQWYGEYLIAMGRTEEALKEIEQARNLDPQSPTLNAVAGWMFYIARDFDRAIELEKSALEMDANFYPAHFWIGQAAEKKGDLDQALAEYKIALELAPDSPEVLASLGHAYAVSGQKEKARQTLGQLDKLSEQNYISPYLKALIYAGSGENEQAVSWLEKGAAERNRAMPFLKVDPMMDNLHSEKRFQELLNRMRF